MPATHGIHDCAANEKLEPRWFEQDAAAAQRVSGAQGDTHAQPHALMTRHNSDVVMRVCVWQQQQQQHT